MNKDQSVNSIYSFRNSAFLLLAIILFFPRGIGIDILGSVIDVNEIVHLFFLLLILRRISLDSFDEKLLFFSLFLPLLFVFTTANYMQAFVNYFLNFLLYFSAFFIGKTFVNQKTILGNTSSFFFNIAIINLIVLAIGLANHYLDFISLDSIRAYDKERLETTAGLSRVITGFENDNSAFRGIILASNIYAFFQTAIFSLLIAYFIFNERKINFKKKIIFLSSIYLSLLGIVLSQSRGALLISILILLICNFLKYLQNNRKISISLYNPLTSLSLLFLVFTIYFYESIAFYLVNISTLLNYLGIAGIGEVVLFTDVTQTHRLKALMYIDDLIFNYPQVLLVGLGLGFWKYSDQIELTHFADAPMLISYLLEVGLVVYLISIIVLFSLLYNLRKKHSIYFSLPILISFISLILCLQVSSSKELYWLVFFLLGILFKYNYDKKKYSNHNSSI